MHLSQVSKVGLLFVLFSFDLCVSFHEKPGKCPKIESVDEFNMQRVSIEWKSFIELATEDRKLTIDFRQFFFLLFHFSLSAFFIFSFWECGTSFRAPRQLQRATWMDAFNWISLKSIHKTSHPLNSLKTGRLPSEFLTWNIHRICSSNWMTRMKLPFMSWSLITVIWFMIYFEL